MITKTEELKTNPLNKFFTENIFKRFKAFSEVKKNEGNLCICPKCNNYCKNLSKTECTSSSNSAVNQCKYTNNKCETTATSPYCDKCTSKTAKLFEKFKYQEFLYQYMQAHNKATEQYFKHDSINSRGLLIYHGLGSGKTCSGVILAEACRTYNLKVNPELPSKKQFKRKVIYMIPANLFLDPWIQNLSGFCNSNVELREELAKATKDNDRLLKEGKGKKPPKMRQIYINICKKHNYFIIHYNAEGPEGRGGWMDKLSELPTRFLDSSNEKWDFTNKKNEKRLNPFDDSVVIIDEVHNVINSITRAYVDGVSNKVKLYGHLMNSLNTKLIFLSGTPMINKGFELTFLFNLLRGPISYKDKTEFEVEEEKFDNLFFDKDGKLKNKDMFSRRINGLVSYYKGIDDTVFAKKIQEDKFVLLKGIQKEVYKNMHKIEQKIAKEKNERGKSSDEKVISQIGYTRQSSNFVFPSYIFDVNALMKLKDENKLRFTVNFPERPINELVIPYSKGSGKRILHGYVKSTDSDNMTRSINLLKININKPLEGNKLKLYSMKMYHILQYIKKSNGPVIVFSSYVDYGIKVFAEVLNQNGYSDYDDEDIPKNKGIKYMLWTGTHKNHKTKDIFNKYENMNGKLIKVFLLTTAGKEGISLFGIRQIHILEPFYNSVLDRQVIGRGIRICSHSHIPESDFIDFSKEQNPENKNKRIVNIFKWYAYIDRRMKGTIEESKIEKKLRIKKEKTDIINLSTDHRLMSISKKKYNVEVQLMKLLQNNSIDCNISNYDNCFTTEAENSDFIKIWNLQDKDIKKDKSSNIINILEDHISIKKSNLLCLNIDENINIFMKKFNRVNAIVSNINEYNNGKDIVDNIKQDELEKYISLQSEHFNKLLGKNTVIYMNSNKKNISNICNKISTKCKYIIVSYKKKDKIETTFLKENKEYKGYDSFENKFLLINNSKNSNNLVTFILEKLRKDLKWNSQQTLDFFYFFYEMDINTKELLKKRIKDKFILSHPKNKLSYKNYIDISKIVYKDNNLNKDYHKLLLFLYKTLKSKIKKKETEINKIYKILYNQNIHTLNDLTCNIQNLDKKLPAKLLLIITDLLRIENMKCNEKEWLNSLSKIKNKV